MTEAVSKPIGSTMPQLQQKITLEKATQQGKYHLVSLYLNALCIYYIDETHYINPGGCYT